MTKKGIIRVLIAVLTIGLLFTGCGPKEPEKGKQFANPVLNGVPGWVLAPKVEGMISEIGTASPNAGNDIGLQRTEAMGKARDNLARLIQTKVGNMLKSFKSTTGSGKSATFDKSTEDVSKQIAKQTLNGTVVKGTWINELGTMFILMAIDTKGVADIMEKEIKTSYKNDKALYQKFIAAKAQGDLKKELEAFNK